MATSRFQPRSNRTTRTCRACEGAGEQTVGPYLRPSPYDDAHRCETCDGAGFVAFRDPDLLERVRYARTFVDREFFGYSRLRREATRRVALPGVAA